MAHDYDLASSTVDKPAEHPAKAIMAKRWEERRAEARARRMAAKLQLGDSGLITLRALADAAAISSRPPTAADSSSTGSDVLSSTDASSSTPLATTAENGTPTLAELAATLPVPVAESSGLPAADSGGDAPASPALAQQSQAPSWLRDSRKAMLVVALISHCLLLALLYFGGFLG